jgi:hypothetical protein
MIYNITGKGDSLSLNSKRAAIQFIYEKVMRAAWKTNEDL